MSEDTCVQKISNGEQNGVEKSCSPPPSENCEEHRVENNYSCSPRPNKKIFVGALTPETTERMPFSIS